MKKQTVMIVGLGELGGALLEYLVRVPNLACRLVTADIDAESGQAKTMAARQGAAFWGHYPEIDFVRLDLMQTEQTAETLSRIAPDIVFNAATLASWWVRSLLPPEVHERLYVFGTGSGAWTAMHLTLAYRLMLAVRAAGIDPIVVNGSYPDVVNPVLAKVGLAPAVGIGNVDLAVPPIRLVAARKLGLPARSVEVHLVAHHFHAYNILYEGGTRGVPVYLKVVVAGTDVTPTLDLPGFFREVSEAVRGSLTPKGGTYVTAGSASRTLLGLLHDTGEPSHAPGPAGLPGGYPVRLSQSGVAPALPGDLSLDEAIGINEAGQRAEGVERIEADGTVVFTDVASTVMREVLGADYRRFRPGESQDVARDLGSRLKELGGKFGLSLQVH